MSALRRLVSGSIASWVKIGVTLIAQIALVPVYLTYWDASQYGLWLAIASFVAMLRIFNVGYLQFIGHEFLKCGAERPEELSRILSSAIPFGIGTGALQILIAWCFVQYKLVHSVFEVGSTVSAQLLDDAATVVLLLVIVYGIFQSVGGILVRLMGAIGYYPRMAWWGVIHAIVIAGIPALLVVSGAGLFEAGFALALTTLIYYIFAFADIFRLLRKTDLRLQKPDFLLGALNLWRSQVLVVVSLSDLARQQGVRLVMAPFVGAAGIAAFSTLRTAANVAHQGLGTITGPLMPELMRALRQRDQARSEAAFATVWLLLVGAMSPGVVLLQANIEPLFLAWTRGQIDFDPVLFGVLSLGVLLFALAQPAMSVVKGNNLLRPQLLIAVMAAAIVVGGMVILVPVIGILGAGIALLTAEVFAAAGFRIVAKRWLEKNGLEWPKHAAASAAMSVWITALAIAGLVFLPNMTWVVLPCAFLLLGVNAIVYWRSLPGYAKARFRSIIEKVYPRRDAV